MLTKPGCCIKVYDIWVRGRADDEHIAQALKGAQSKGELLKALELTRIGIGKWRFLSLDEKKALTRNIND